MAVSSVLNLPRELIALVGKACDPATRNACRLAHSRFSNVHEDYTYHCITLSTAEGSRERLEACLRLKPRLQEIEVKIQALKEGAVDLSPIQGIQKVGLYIKGCGNAVQLMGIHGAHATLCLTKQSTVTPELLGFLLLQSSLSLHIYASHCAALLGNKELMAKVTGYLHIFTCRNTDPSGMVLDLSLARGCSTVYLHVVHDRLQVTSADAITDLFIDHLQLLGGNGIDEDWTMPKVRTWFNAGTLGARPRLMHLTCWNFPWGQHSASDDTLAGYLAELVHTTAPTATLQLEVSHPDALQFVQQRVPKDAKLEFACQLGANAAGGANHDTYVAARIAQLLLRPTRQVAVHCPWNYEPPTELKNLATVRALYDEFHGIKHRRWWYWLTFFPAAAATTTATTTTTTTTMPAT